MEVPNRLKVDLNNDYCSDSSDYDHDYDEDFAMSFTRKRPFTTIKSPPEKLTLPKLNETREQDNTIDDASFRTPSLRNNIDPVSASKQIRLLHNRVRLIENELQAQSNRQILIIGVLSVYLVSRCFNWMFR